MPRVTDVGSQLRSVLLARLSSGGSLRFAIVWLIVGMLIRTAFLGFAVATDRTYLELDEVRVARSLVDGTDYSFSYYNLFDEPLTPSAFFPPAYVYDVYLLYKVFGSYLALVIQNLLLSLGVSIVLFILARRLFGDLTARATLILSIFYLPFIGWITHGSPVYFKMLIMTLLVLMLVRIWAAPTLRQIFLAGMVAGLLALSMPDALVYAGLLALALIVRKRTGVGLARAALLLLGASVVIAPWTTRNWVRFSERCLISSNGGFNFYMGHNADTRHEVDYQQVLELDLALDGELSRSNEFERDRILYREAFRYIREHPLDTASNLLRRCVLHWTFRPSNLSALRSTFAGETTRPATYLFYIWSQLAFYLPLLALACRGIWLWRRRSAELVPVLLTFVYSTLVSMAFVVQTKQRLIKVEPFLILFAAYAIVAHLAPKHSGTMPADRRIDESLSGT